MIDDDNERELEELRRRVGELLVHNTKIENERRSWKARAEAATACLRAVTVEVPLAAGGVQIDALQTRAIFAEVRHVAERADMLERDAWTQWAPVVRAFIEQAREPMGDYAPAVVVPVEDGSPAGIFVRAWVARFAALFTD